MAVIDLQKGSPCHGVFTLSSQAINQSVESIQVEMNSGSMVLWVGGMRHASGANTTTDQE